VDYPYPILEKVFEYYNKIPHKVGEIFLVGCQHLLEPQMKMFEYLIKFGFNPKKIIMLGKAYSTNNEIVEELNKIGIQAIQPKFSGINFDEEHRENCRMLFNLVNSDAEIVIMDDGAELIRTFVGSGRRINFGVEQTSSGFRLLKDNDLGFPVFNVARSATKLNQESPLVARHLCERIFNYFQSKNILNPNILIVGLGPIGEAILEVLKEHNLLVEGFDIKYGHSDLLTKICDLKPNVIIGATGSTIITKEDLETISLTHDVFLISASSSDREFPVVSFRDNQGVHEDVIYKNFIFVNNGFPFSFMGNRHEMTPMEIEKTMCLLSGSIMHGVVKGAHGSGLLEIPKELEDIINQSD